MLRRLLTLALVPALAAGGLAATPAAAAADPQAPLVLGGVPGDPRAGTQWTPQVTGGSTGAAVTLAAGPTAVCALDPEDPATVLLRGAGQCTVTATMPGTTLPGDPDDPVYDEVTTDVVLDVRHRDVSVAVALDPAGGGADPADPGEPVTVTATVTDTADGTPVPSTAAFVVSDAAETGGPMTATAPGVLTGAFTAVAGATHAVTVSVTPLDQDVWAVPADAGGSVTVRRPQTVAIEAPDGPLLVGTPWTPALTGGDSAEPVVLASESTAICTVADGVVTPIAHGDCDLRATQAGDEDHAAGEGTLTVGVRQPLTLTVTATPSQTTVGTQVRVVISATGGVPAVPVSLADAPVTLTVGGAPAALTSGTGPDAGRLVHTFTPAAEGTLALVAAHAGGAVFQATGGSAEVTVGTVARTVSFDDLPEATELVPDGGSWTPAISTHPAGGAVTLTSSDEDVCRVAAGTVTFREPGACVLTASVAADAGHGAATATLTLTVPQRLSLSVAAPAITYGQVAEIVVSATGDDGAVPLTPASTVLTVAGVTRTTVAGTGARAGMLVATIPGLAAADHAVTATRAAQDGYQPASAGATLTVAPAPQTITIMGTPTADQLVAGGTWTPELNTTTTATDPAPTLTSTTPAVCTVSAAAPFVVDFVAPGTCTLTARLDSGPDHVVATDTRTVAVAARLSLSVAAPAITYGQVAEIVVSATGDDGAVPLTPASTVVTVAGTPVTTVAGTGDRAGMLVATIPGLAARGHDVTATRAAQDGYQPASAKATLTVAPAPQTIDIMGTPTADQLVAGGTWTPELSTTTTATDPAPTLTSTTPAVCTVSAAAPFVVDFVAPGTCTLTARLDSGTNHVVATDTRDLVVRRPLALVVTGPVGPPVYGDTVTLLVRGTEGPGGAPITLVPAQLQVDLDPAVDGSPVLTEDGAGVRIEYTPDRAGPHEVTVRAPQTLELQGTDTTLPVTVAKAPQTLTVGNPAPPQGLVGDTWAPGVTGGGSTASIAVDSTTEDICEVDSPSATVSFLSHGRCELVASRAGDANHLPADDLTVALEVRIPVSLGLRAVGTATVGERLELRAVARSGGTGLPGSGWISPTASAPAPEAVAWFGGAHLSSTFPARAGLQTATARFVPDEHHKYATVTATHDYTVGRASQEIRLANPAPSPARVTGTWDPGVVDGPSTAPVRTTAVGTPAGACAADAGIVRFGAAGTCTVTFTQDADDDYDAAPPVTVTVQVDRVPVAVVLAPQGPARVGVPLTLRATATALMPDGSTVPVPGSGAFHLGGTAADTPTWSTAEPADTGSAVVTPVAAGSHQASLAFTPQDAATFAPATPSVPITVARGTQAVSFDPAPAANPASGWVGRQWTPVVHAPGAGSTAQLRVAAPGGAPEDVVCTLEAGEVTFHRAGACTVVAERPATADHSAAAPAEHTVRVLRNPVEVEVSAPSDATVGEDVPVTVTVRGLPGADSSAAVPLEGTVTLGLDGATGAASEPLVLVDGEAAGTVELPGPGLHRVVAEVVADDAVTWADGTGSAQVIADRRQQYIEVTNPLAGPARVGGGWEPAAVASSALDVALSIGSGEGVTCEVDAGGDRVAFLAEGTCEVIASQAGDTTYWPAAPVRTTVAVTRVPTTTSVVVSGGGTVGRPATVTATSDGPGLVRFRFRQVDPDAAPGDPGRVLAEHLAEERPLVGGRAQLSVVPPDVGSVEVVAELVPDPPGMYVASRSSAGWTVGRAPTTTTVDLDRTSVRVRVSSDDAAAGTPEGTVTVTIADRAPVDLTLADGAASTPHGFSGAEDAALEVAYSGDALRAPSSATGRRGVPVITASVPAAPGSGWHTGPVTVRFTCTTASAPLATACPEDVVLSADSAGHRVRREILAVDGGRAEVEVSGVRIDRTPPRVALAGTRAGATYLGSAPAARCVGSDATSGLAGCAVQERRRLNRTTFADTVVAVDRAGNRSTASARFTVLPEWVAGATRSGSRWVVRGRVATLRVVGDATPPRVLRPKGTGGAPRVLMGRMTPIRISNGVWTWERRVKLPARLRAGRPWRLAVQTGSTRVELPVVRRRR